MSSNTRIIERWHGYYLSDTQCQYCLFYAGKKSGCKLDKCCCLEERQDAIANGRINRKRGALALGM